MPTEVLKHGGLRTLLKHNLLLGEGHHQGSHPIQFVDFKKDLTHIKR